MNAERPRAVYDRVADALDAIISRLRRFVLDLGVGRLVYVAGKMQTRRWRRDGEDSDRFCTEILPAAPVNGSAMPTGERPCAGGRHGPDSGQAGRGRRRTSCTGPIRPDRHCAPS